MLKRFLQTSILWLLIKKIKIVCASFNVQIKRIYADSQIHKLISKIKEGLITSFKYSILGKASEIKTEEKFPVLVLDNSRFIMRLIKLYKSGKENLTDYLKISKTDLFLNQLKRELYFSSIKTISNILVVAIPINIILSILFKIDIGILGWIMRVLLLFISLGGSFCDASREDIKKSSFILKDI